MKFIQTVTIHTLELQICHFLSGIAVTATRTDISGTWKKDDRMRTIYKRQPSGSTIGIHF